jgi:hypothetical protein
MSKRNLALATLMSVLLAAHGLAAAPPAAPAPANDLKGKLEAVTVYRGQALVTRVVDVTGAAGLREIVVGDLPPAIDPNNLFAESSDSIEVRSVLYRERPVDQDVRADVRKFDDQIRDLQDKLAGVQRSRQVVTDQQAYVAKLEQFVAPTATVEMTKGVLNAETLKTVSLFILDQRKTLADQDLKLGLDLRNLQEQLSTLQRQRDQIAQQSARTVREAVVFVNVKPADAANAPKLRVRYMVSNATWDPSYNIRANGKGAVNLEYNAAIQQQSGEDWTDVAMTLSTATPSLVARAPQLDPLLIGLTAGGKIGDEMDYAEVQQNFGQKKAQLEQERNRAGNGANFGANFSQSNANAPGGPPGMNRDGLQAERDLNEVAGQQQLAELLAKPSGKERAGGKIASDSEVISVTYDLTARTSLPSRSDRQLIQVATVPLKGEFYKVAAPVLTNYVYDQATLTNEGKMVLLAGPTSSYMAGQFVGNGQIPTIAAGESFVVGFGIDSSLRVSRERVEKADAIQSGSRVLSYTYRLTVQNFAGQPATVRLMDRLPSTRENVKETDVRVTLDPPTVPPLSTDADYLRTERKQGILRWDVQVPAAATGDKAYTLDYKFKIEYDKQMAITGMPAAAAK